MCRLGVLLAVVVALGCVGAVGKAAPSPTSDVYGGLGAWVDVFDTRIWASPDGATATMRAHGVETVYVQTSNSSQPTDVVRPGQLGRLVESAHSAGMKVVAWYLPTLRWPARDLRRARAALSFRTPSGQAFDSFALDVESSAVRSVSARNRRLLLLADGLRRAAPTGYEIGAIVPSPVGMDIHQKYWPGFPWAELRARFDVFLPMAYFTYRLRAPAAVTAYVRRVVTSIRVDTGDPAVPIHVIGGIANRASDAALRSFVTAASTCEVLGASLYDFGSTTAAGRSALARFAPAAGSDTWTGGPCS
jgi:hypothetical protein